MVWTIGGSDSIFTRVNTYKNSTSLNQKNFKLFPRFTCKSPSIHIETTIAQNVHHFLRDVKAECEGTKEAGAIIRKYLKDGSISHEEEVILKTQLMDSLKIMGIGIPFVLIPGASILMPIIIREASKHHIDLLPSAFDAGEKTVPPLPPLV